MLIKKAYQGEFKHLLSILRAAVLDNRTYVAFPKKKFAYLPILRSLRTAGIIESYDERDEIVIIGLKQVYWKSQQHPLHSFSTLETFLSSRRKVISSKRLYKYQSRQGQIIHIEISTDKGVLTGLEAVTKNTGGVPLFKIY